MSARLLCASLLFIDMLCGMEQQAPHKWVDIVSADNCFFRIREPLCSQSTVLSNMVTDSDCVADALPVIPFDGTSLACFLTIMSYVNPLYKKGIQPKKIIKQIESGALLSSQYASALVVADGIGMPNKIIDLLNRLLVKKISTLDPTPIEITDIGVSSKILHNQALLAAIITKTPLSKTLHALYAQTNYKAIDYTDANEKNIKIASCNGDNHLSTIIVQENNYDTQWYVRSLPDKKQVLQRTQPFIKKIVGACDGSGSIAVLYGNDKVNIWLNSLNQSTQDIAAIDVGIDEKISDLAFNRNYVVIQNLYGLLDIWNLKQRKNGLRYHYVNTLTCRSIRAITLNDKNIFIMQKKGKIFVYDSATGKYKKNFTIAFNCSLFNFNKINRKSFIIAANNISHVAITKENISQVWNWKSEKLLFTKVWPRAMDTTFFSNGGDQLFIGNGQEGHMLRLYDAHLQQEIDNLSFDQVFAIMHILAALKISQSAIHRAYKNIKSILLPCTIHKILLAEKKRSFFIEAPQKKKK